MTVAVECAASVAAVECDNVPGRSAGISVSSCVFFDASTAILVVNLASLPDPVVICDRLAVRSDLFCPDFTMILSVLVLRYSTVLWVPIGDSNSLDRKLWRPSAASV